MKIALHTYLSEHTFAKALEGAFVSVTFELDDLDRLEPVGASPRKENAGSGQWELDVSGLKATIEFRTPNDLAAGGRFEAVQQEGVLTVDIPPKVDEETNFEKILMSGAAVLMSGAVTFLPPETPEESKFLKSLAPPGVAILAITIEPAGLHIRAKLPAAFFPPPDPANDPGRVVVLRPPQRNDSDWERFDVTDERQPCWTFSSQPFPDANGWTARTWVDAHANSLRGASDANSFIDSVRLNQSQKDNSGECVVRLGRMALPSEVRWVARGFDVSIGLAAGEGEFRTKEAHFRPDVLIGAFNGTGRSTVPAQFQALPRKARTIPSWYRTDELENADYRIVVEATASQYLRDHPLMAYRGPIRTTETENIPQEAWLCIDDGWVMFPNDRVLSPLSDEMTEMEQLRGNLDPFALSQAFAADHAAPQPLGAPQTKLQIAAIDFRKDEDGTHISLVLPHKTSLGLYFWRPRLVLTTPPLWARHPAAKTRGKDESVDRDDASRFVPSLLPPVGSTLESYDPKSSFGSFVFVSQHAAKVSQKPGLKALLNIPFGGQQWSLRFDRQEAVTWSRPKGEPWVSAFPAIDSPRADTTLDDRRGLIPLHSETGEFAVQFPLGSNIESSALPSLSETLQNWQAKQSNWLVDRAIDGTNYFLSTLAGIEAPFKKGQETMPELRLRHANPALDESYARVTEDQKERLIGASLEADMTRVHGAVAFSLAGEEAHGWLPGQTVKVTNIEAKLEGLEPALKFEVDGVPIDLKRPTVGDRHGDLVNLGLKSTWSDDFAQPETKVVKFEPRSFNAIVGGGQPLLTRPLEKDQAVRVMDGLGRMLEEPDINGRIRQRTGEAPIVERVTETRTLGQRANGDLLVLELAGVTLGKRSDLTPEELRTQRWRLHDGNQGQPRLRGFPLKPLALDEISDKQVELQAVLVANEAMNEVGGRQPITLRFEREENDEFSRTVIVAGSIDWIFNGAPTAKPITRLARVRAQFLENSELTARNLELKLTSVTLALPFGQAELTKCECQLIRNEGGDVAEPWILTIRAAHHSEANLLPNTFSAKTPAAVNATAEHELGWCFVVPGSLSPPTGPSSFKWTGHTAQAAETETKWEIRYGQSTDCRPSDLRRFRFDALQPPLSDGQLKDVIGAANDYISVADAKDPRTRDRREAFEERLIVELNRWLNSETFEVEPLLALLPLGHSAQRWFALWKKLGEPLKPIEHAWLRRTALEFVAATANPSPTDWQNRWHSRLIRQDLPGESLDIMGDVVLEQIRINAARLTFKITRDIHVRASEKKRLARHLRFDSLGGFLGVEVFHTESGMMLGNVAVQLQLILRDRFRRDAIGVWNEQRETFSIREDQLGEVQSFAGFAKIVNIKRQDVAWATLGSNGDTVFRRWTPEFNHLARFEPGLESPRNARDIYPLSRRTLLVIDDQSQVSEVVLLPPPATEPGASPVGERVVQEVVKAGDQLVHVELMATNYAFAGRKAAWTRKDQPGCWLLIEGQDPKFRFADKTIKKMCFADEVLVVVIGETLVVFDGVENNLPPIPDAAVILAVDSLAKAPLVVAYKRTGEELVRLRWFLEPDWTKWATEDPLDQVIPFGSIDQMLALTENVCAIRSGKRVALVKRAGDQLATTELDAGSLVPDEIDLLDLDIDGQTPIGDLLFRGPASRSLCTAVLSYSATKPPELEISGKLVLQNDVRFFEKRKTAAGPEVKCDCTHRLDLFLDRARVPVRLLFGALKDDYFISGIAHHVFRFSDGAERIWQAPQLVRLTSFDRIARFLPSSTINSHYDDLVFDASCVTWLQEMPPGDRDPAAVPFDGHRRGGAEVINPLFGLRLHSKPRGAFDKAKRVRLPFLASIAFARLGQEEGDTIPPPEIEIPSGVDAPRVESGAQYPLLPPRLVEPRPPREYRAADGIDFLSRTLQGRWLDSDFLRYSLLPEPLARHAAARELVNESPLTTVPENEIDLIWPAFSQGEGKLPKSIDDLAALRGSAFEKPVDEPRKSPQRGDRRHLAAATLARKVAGDPRVLTGPALVEFPFHVELRAANYTESDELDTMLTDGREVILDDEEPGVDLQLVVYEAGEIRRLLRETNVLLDPVKLNMEYLEEWAHQRLRERSYVDDVMLVRDYHQIIPIPAAPGIDNQELPESLDFASNLALPTDVEPQIDPRCIPYSESPLVAGADLTPILISARPITDEEGLAPPYSATRWRLAKAGGLANGVLREAQSRSFGSRGGYTSHHVTPFEVVARGDYPAPLPDRICKLLEAFVQPTDLPQMSPTSVIQPPWWEVAGWSDRPGEYMTTSFRVSEMKEGDVVRQSAEQSCTLRRSRTATLKGGQVELEPVSLTLPSSWDRFGEAFRPQDLRLVQTLTQSTLKANEVRLFLVNDQFIHVSATSAAASAANPALITKGASPPPKLYVIAGQSWPEQPGEDETIEYAIRSSDEIGATVKQDGSGDKGTTEEIRLKLESYLGEPNVFLRDIGRADGASFISISKDLIETRENSTYYLVEYRISKEVDLERTLTWKQLGAISIAIIEQGSRIRPLKTAVAILDYSEENGADVGLAGYGQLGAERFSAIAPAISGTSMLTIDWQRSAVVRVMQRSPTKEWKYEAIVTGPSGETFPFVKSPE